MNDDFPVMPDPYHNMGNYDPIHAMLVKRKQQHDSGEEVLEPKLEYKNEDVKALEEFCRKMGIVGFSICRMNPKTALMMLKTKMGLVENPSTPTPKSDKQQLLYG